FAGVFKTKTRDEWAAVFEGKDACVAPVLDLNEVAQHPHNREREVIIDIDGVPQPAPAPKLSRTPGKVTKAGGLRGSDMREILTELGYPEEKIKDLLETEIVEQVE
ncbi:MAG: CoA transferase, partial [Deltaproteobacteria bacterium]|nr:CoA transferase [Deltaproteobacteria bacterium]MBW2035436.1 CoA transferase [Deltaproteobacteria bacterium]